MMKKIMILLASTLIAFGCTRINVAEVIPVPDGEMPVKLTVDGLSVGTKSYVSGQEKGISSIWMVCFDKTGTLITSRKGEIQPNDDKSGTLTGHVPASTARIHFIANYADLDLSSFGMGAPEINVMKSLTLSSGISDEIRFWGFHSEATPNEMAGWLVGSNSKKNKVLLMRDRARVTVINEDTEVTDTNPVTITSLTWTISNGLNRGYLAAASASSNPPYTNDYTTATLITEYRSSGVYTITSEGTDGTWTAPGADNPQFLFENSNLSVPVKLIVHASYSDGSSGYHTLLLQDDDKSPYQVFRNNSFVLRIKNLPSPKEASSMGSSSLTDAVSTTNYSNNPYAQVVREVDEISSDQFKLKVEKVVKIFHDTDKEKEGETPSMIEASGKLYGVVYFEYSPVGEGSTTDLTKDNFKVTWEDKDSSTDPTANAAVTESAVEINYSGSTHKGSVKFELTPVIADLKHNSFLLSATNSGLSRFVDVYSITEFAYGSDPALNDANVTHFAGDQIREVYKLDFKLDADYPLSLYPATVRIYSSSLTPYSDADANSSSGSFAVVVGDTKGLQQSPNADSWNYRAHDWGSWYEYTIDTPSANNEYSIYLYETLNNMTVKPTKVGLYLEVIHYGDPKALTADAKSQESTVQTFTQANFTRWSGNSSTSTLGNVQVVIANSDRYRDSYGWTDTEYALRIGRDAGNGTITVTPPSGKKVCYIEISYFHRDEETETDWWSGSTEIIWPAKDFVGGNVTASSGTYARHGMTGTWTGESSGAVTLTMSPDDEGESPRVTTIKVIYI